MELKEGMYVKINGFISKIGKLHTSKKGQTYMQFKQPNGMLADMNIKIYDGKASHNIIDLIEVGDYVNGKEVLKVYRDELRLNTENDILCFIKEKDIESIVTKEQFESMSYKVDDAK